MHAAAGVRSGSLADANEKSGAMSGAGGGGKDAKSLRSPSHCREEDGAPLATNWKSALCVTSVFDAMAQLQRDNDALREELRDAKQTHDIFAAKAIEADQLREPERVNSCEQHEQEIRILRGEKRQLEQRLEQQRDVLEAKVQHAEATCQQQITKYQEKYALDPNASKRVALSVQTLRDTLDKVVEEKEELTIRYSQLTDLYRQLQQESSRAVQALQDKLAGLKAQRGMQRVVGVLARWSTSNVERAWRRWTQYTAIERVQTQERTTAMDVERRLQGYVNRLVVSRIEEIRSKVRFRRTRELFCHWRSYWTRKRQRIALVAEARRLYGSHAMAVTFSKWKQQFTRDRGQRACVDSLYGLLQRHSARRALHRWIAFVNSDKLAAGQREASKLITKISLLTADLDNTRRQLDHAHAENQQLQASNIEERQSSCDLLRQQQLIELAIKQKMGKYLRKQSDRQLLATVWTSWRGATSRLKLIQRRIAAMQTKQLQNRIRRGIDRWRRIVDVRHRYAPIIHKLRNICLVRCFNSWKQTALEASAKKNTIQRALWRMKHHQLAKCYLQWQDFRGRRVAARQHISALCRRVENRQLSAAMALWRACLYRLKSLQSQQEHESKLLMLENRFLQTKGEIILLQRCFFQWVQHVVAQRDRFVLIKKYAARWRSGTLVRAMRSWSEFCSNRRNARQLVVQWVFKSCSSRLLSSFQRWKQHAIEQRQQMAQYELKLQGAHAWKLMNELVNRHSMMNEELIQRYGNSRREQEGAWTALQTMRYRQKRYRAAILAMCRKNCQNDLMKRMMRKWHCSVAYHKMIRRVGSVLVSKSSMGRLTSVFNAWKAMHAQQKHLHDTLKRFKVYYLHYSLSLCFNAWRSHWHHQSSIVRFMRKVSSCANANVLRVMFGNWRQLTRTSHLLRRTVSRFMLQSARFRMKEALSKWSAIAASEKKQHRDRVLAAVRFTISSKWLLSQCRTCFMSWKYLVAANRARQRAELKLRATYHGWLLQGWFDTWRINVQDQIALRGMLCRWLDKAVRQKQARAFRMWKSAVLRIQMDDVQLLRTVRTRQQDELVQFEHTNRMLVDESVELRSMLSDAAARHSSAINDLQQSKSWLNLSKHFTAWRIRVVNKSQCAIIVDGLIRTRYRRTLACCVMQWRLFLRHRQTINIVIDERSYRCKTRIKQTYFRRWLEVFIGKSTLRGKEHAINQRVSMRVKRESFLKWNSRLQANRKVAEAVQRLDATVIVVTLRKGFAIWRNYHAEANRIIQQNYTRQQRLDALRISRSRYLLTRIFFAWHEVCRARQRIILQAKTRGKRNRSAAMFARWRSEISTWKQRRLCIERILNIHQLSQKRTALRHWERHIRREITHSLQEENARLLVQNQQCQHDIAAKAEEVERLVLNVADARNSLEAVEIKLAAMADHSARTNRDSTVHMMRMSALLQILLRQLVPTSVVQAFYLWKTRNIALEQHGAAIARFSSVLRRLLQLRGFSTWKTRIKCAQNCDRFQISQSKRLLQWAVSAWRRFTHAKAAARLYLARRLLLYYAGPQRAAWSFQKWKLTTLMGRMTEQVLALTTASQHSTDKARILYRRLALAKWCWRAYFHQLRRMRAFLANCQTRASKRLHSDHEQSMLAIREAHARERPDIACICEGIVAGPPIRAIQAMLRRVSQASTVLELFAGVGSAFGQFLHGCSGLSIRRVDFTWNRVSHCCLH